MQGFRKIDSDKWEFANEGFQGGKKHLLKTIKRRSRYNNNNYKKQHLGLAMALKELTKPIVGTELETLKTDNTTLTVEMLKLREQQQDSQYQLTMMEDRVRRAECKQQKMFSFLTKMSRNPDFFLQLLQKRMPRKELNGNHDFEKNLLTMQPELTHMFPEVIEAGPIETPFQAWIDNKSTNPGAADCTPPSTIFAENMAIDEELTTSDSNFILEL